MTEAIGIGDESLTQETNPFGASSIQSTPVGIDKANFNVGNGFFDPATDALHTALGTVIGINRQVTVAPYTNTIGKPCYCFEGNYTQKYEVLDRRDNLTLANVNYLISGQLDESVVVLNLQALTATWDTKTGGAGITDAPVDYTLDPANRAITITSNTLANPTVVTTFKPHGRTTGDKILVSNSNSTPSLNGVQTVTVTGANTFTVPVNVTVAGTLGSFVLATTNAGGIGYLHITAYSGFTSVVNKIMHSPDDITYAALITFATNTAVGKERKTSAGLVDRYLSSQGTVSGAGSITLFEAFSRN